MRRDVRTRRTATVGVVEHASSAVLVTVAPGAELIDRRRIDLTDRGLPTHPHHHQGSWAVGRYLNTPGARRLSLSDAVALVERVRASAGRGARAGLEALAAAVPVPIAGIAIRACPELPPTVEERIADNRAQTVADSVMYRQALAAAAGARGWTVHWYDRERVFRDAAAVLGREDVHAFLSAMGRSVGPPWRAEHKLAAAAALAATGPPASGGHARGGRGSMGSLEEMPMTLQRIVRIALSGLLVAAISVAAGFAQDGYRTPPDAITKILDSPAPPAVSVSSDRRWLLITTSDVPETSIAELAEPTLFLAGRRFQTLPRAPHRSRRRAHRVAQAG